jgi:hypothetical protein
MVKICRSYRYADIYQIFTLPAEYITRLDLALYTLKKVFKDIILFQPVNVLYCTLYSTFTVDMFLLFRSIDTVVINAVEFYEKNRKKVRKKRKHALYTL